MNQARKAGPNRHLGHRHLLGALEGERMVSQRALANWLDPTPKVVDLRHLERDPGART